MATVRDMRTVADIIGSVDGQGRTVINGKQVTVNAVYECIDSDSLSAEWHIYFKGAHIDVNDDPFILDSVLVWAYGPGLLRELGTLRAICAVRSQAISTLSAKYGFWHETVAAFLLWNDRDFVDRWEQYTINGNYDRVSLIDAFQEWRDEREQQE